MTKEQRFQKLVSMSSKFMSFFSENYDNNLPSMKKMLSDIEKIQDPVYRFGLTLTLIGDSTKSEKILQPLDRLAMTSLHNWVEGNYSENDLESLRKDFLQEFGNRFIKEYDDHFHNNTLSL